MFGWLLGRGRSKRKPGVLIDPDFGRISFDADGRGAPRGIWQMHDDWPSARPSEKLSCNSIPGTVDGPDPEARGFLLAKKGATADLWIRCAPTLEEVRERWPRLEKSGPLESTFCLSSVGLDEPITDPPRWSVGFESYGFWVYVEISFVGEKVVGYVCDT
jgi:hypothetical protein